MRVVNRAPENWEERSRQGALLTGPLISHQLKAPQFSWGGLEGILLVNLLCTEYKATDDFSGPL